MSGNTVTTIVEPECKTASLSLLRSVDLNIYPVSENKPILCCNANGSGGGSGYTTATTLHKLAQERHRTFIKEQKLWKLRAELQSPEDAFQLAEMIRINRILIDLLHEESCTVILVDEE